MQIIPAKKYLTREERQMLMQKNDALAVWEVFLHYLWITGAFTLVYCWTNVFTIILALFILGGQQLGCAILMHDSGHLALFKSQKLNNFIGQWLGAYLIFNDMKKYRHYHFIHHNNTGLTEDPDLLLTRGYPTNRKSMQRKFIRDFTGQTGIKAFLGMMMMHLGYLEYNLGGSINKVDQSNRSWSDLIKMAFQNLSGPFLANAILLGILWVLASPWLYLLWIGAYLTTFQFSIRVRSIAEHSVVEDPSDPYRNTRTTKANWFERLLFAPYHVNYHAEHHMMMSVPSYNLPKMHQLLKEKKFYEKGLLANNYLDIIRMAGGEQIHS